MLYCYAGSLRLRSFTLTPQTKQRRRYRQIHGKININHLLGCALRRVREKLLLTHTCNALMFERRSLSRTQTHSVTRASNIMGAGKQQPLYQCFELTRKYNAFGYRDHTVSVRLRWGMTLVMIVTKYIACYLRSWMDWADSEAPRSREPAHYYCVHWFSYTQPISFPQRDCTAVWLLTSR